MDAAVIKALRDRVPPVNQPISSEVIAQQQETADFQLKQKTIRKPIDVSKVVDNQFIEQALKDAANEPKS
ncbi:putative aliphatic sulfonates-binding protein precursor [compost metagenome]